MGLLELLVYTWYLVAGLSGQPLAWPTNQFWEGLFGGGPGGWCNGKKKIGRSGVE
jgi:hypothetical protein